MTLCHLKLWQLGIFSRVSVGSPWIHSQLPRYGTQKGLEEPQIEQTCPPIL